MARAFVDINVFSEDWFTPILKELSQSKNVIFTYGHSTDFDREFGKVRKALEFFQRIGQLKTANGGKRRLDVYSKDIEPQVEFLLGQQCFSGSSDCDDAHIFSLIYAKPTKYVFSMDMRIARCRDHINQYVDNRYCDFIVIGNPEIYKRHRQDIMA